MEFADQLSYRRKRNRFQRTEIKEIGEANNYWLYRSGRYTESFFNDTDPKQENNQVEYKLKQQILAIVKQREIQNDSRPMIVIDFGGMLGLSMLTLAATPELKSLVEKSRLAFVVSNLEFNPDHIQLDKIKPPLSTEIRNLFESYYHLVHYINGNSSQLRTSSIQLPNGLDIMLRNNVSLLHERAVLAHSIMTDIEIPKLMTLLADDGIALLNKDPAQNIMFLKDTAEDADPKLSHLDTHALGMKNALEFGVQYINAESKAAKYDVYAKPKCPIDSSLLGSKPVLTED